MTDTHADKGENQSIGDTPTTDAALGGWTDKMVQQSRLVPADDFARVLDTSRRLERALRLAVAWMEIEEGHTFDYVAESDDRYLAANGTHAWNEQFVAMVKAAREALK